MNTNQVRKFKLAAGFLLLAAVSLGCKAFLGAPTSTVQPDIQPPSETGAPVPVPLEPSPTPDGADSTNPAPEVETGRLEGRVCFPSETTPPMTLYFQDVHTMAAFPLKMEGGETRYGIDLPPGTYIAFAYVDGGEFGGLYSEYVVCGLNVSCPSHQPVQVNLERNTLITGVDICDWYLEQNSLPTRPPEGLVSLENLSGLFYMNRAKSGNLHVIDPSGTPIQVIEDTVYSISPDGSQGVYTDAGDIWLTDFKTRVNRNLTFHPEIRETCLSWSPDGARILYGALPPELEGPTTGYLTEINFTTGQETRIETASVSFACAAYSPDGQQIAYDRYAEGNQAVVHNLQTGETFALRPEEYGLPELANLKFGSPAWSPDGTKIAWWAGGQLSLTGPAAWTLAVVVFDLENQAGWILHPHGVVSGRGGWLSPPSWSPDGRWLALTTQGEVHSSDLWVTSLDGQEIHYLGYSRSPIWSPDSQDLVYIHTQADLAAGAANEIQHIRVGQWDANRVELPSGSVPLAWLVEP